MFQSDKFTQHASDASPVENETDWALLSLYLDGEATPQEVAQVEARLRQDAALAQEFAFLRATSAHLHSVSEVEPPAQLRQAILARTTQRQTLWTRLTASLHATQRTLAFGGTGLALAGGTLAAALLLIGVVAKRNLVPTPAAVVTNLPFRGQTNTPYVVHNDGRDRHSAANPPRLPIPALDLKSPALVKANKPQPSVRPDKELDRIFADLVANNDGSPKKRTDARSAHRIKTPVVAVNFTDKSKVAPLKQLKQQSEPQVPNHIDKSIILANADYSPQPMMDVINQRAPVGHMIHADDKVLGSPVDSSDDSVDTVHVADAAASSDDAPASGVIVRRAHLNLASLPSIPTNGDIKRMADAHNLGYNRATLAGLQRQQATVAVFGGRF